MKCINPITIINKKYKEEQNLSIDERDSNRRYIEVPCGKCIICRNIKSSEWATRLQHEADNYNPITEVTISTLTYNEENINKNYSLNKKDVQDFIKRFRITRERRGYKNKIKYFIAGEYGSTRGRPHYHAILYGVNSFDKREMEILKETWGKGNIYPEMIRQADKTMCYVAKYINKGDNTVEYLDKNEYKKKTNREAQFKLCSSGIGKRFVEENKNNIIANKKIYTNNYEQAIPKQYLKWLREKMNNEEIAKMNTEMSRDMNKKIDEEINNIVKQYEKEGAKKEELDIEYMMAQIRRGQYIQPNEIIELKKNQVYKNIVKRKNKEKLTNTLDKIKNKQHNKSIDVSEIDIDELTNKIMKENNLL